MLERPDLPDEKITACVQDHYGLSVTGIEFVPLGCDTNAWAYQVQTGDGNTWFLKVRKGTVHQPALIVPRYLKDHGIEQVVAPLPTNQQRLWADLEPFALILYPFIDGGSGHDVGMSDAHWIAFGAVIKRIHTVGLSHEFSSLMPKETFKPKWSELIRRLRSRVTGGEYRDRWEAELASFWKDRDRQIMQIVDRAEALGNTLQTKPSGAFVLCHADMHTLNLMLDHDGRLYMVDWDETLLAPKERDLMFVGGGVLGPTDAAREMELFFRGYGEPEIDTLTMAYYRCEWAVSDMSGFGERVFLLPDIGDITKDNAVQFFKSLFEPGAVIEMAYRAEAQLLPELRLKGNADA